MMSQNRKEEKDRRRNENDYVINLKAELQVRSLHDKIDLLQKDQMKVYMKHRPNNCSFLKK
jgi:uncharacterized membrane protein